MSVISGPGARVNTGVAADTSPGDQAPITFQATPGQTGPVMQCLDALGNVLSAVGITGHQITPGGAAPAAAAGSNAGTSPPAPVVTAGANDARGNITFGTGATPAAGNMVAVTFAAVYATAPQVMVVPRNTATQALGLYVTGNATTGFTLACTTAPAASQANTVYSFDYMVEG